MHQHNHEETTTQFRSDGVLVLASILFFLPFPISVLPKGITTLSFCLHPCLCFKIILSWMTKIHGTTGYFIFVIYLRESECEAAKASLGLMFRARNSIHVSHGHDRSPATGAISASLQGLLNAGTWSQDAELSIRDWAGSWTQALPMLGTGILASRLNTTCKAHFCCHCCSLLNPLYLLQCLSCSRHSVIRSSMNEWICLHAKHWLRGSHLASLSQV